MTDTRQAAFCSRCSPYRDRRGRVLASVDLRGYAEYRTRVKYRLVPFVW